MDVAREYATLHHEHTPCLVLAERQMSGRGRLGRKWDATVSGFAGTFVFFSKCEMSALQGYSLVVGCAVARALEKFHVPTHLKWPNDILLANGRKAGGILIEILKIEGKVCVLTGIGLNIISPSSNFSESGALFGDSHEKVPTVCELTVPIVQELLLSWNVFEREGFRGFRDEWLSRAAGIGKELLIESGKRRIRGLFTGVDENGNLTLERDGKLEVFPGAQIVKGDQQ